MKSLAVQARALALPVTRHCNDTLLSSYDERFPAYFFCFHIHFRPPDSPNRFNRRVIKTQEAEEFSVVSLIPQHYYKYNFLST